MHNKAVSKTELVCDEVPSLEKLLNSVFLSSAGMHLNHYLADNGNQNASRIMVAMANRRVLYAAFFDTSPN